jgi:prolyl-tRNA synthetase
MEQFQSDLFEAAKTRREKASLRGATKAQFIEKMEQEGGFVYGGFCGRPECEAEIKDQTKATIRVLPDEEFRSEIAPTTCMWCGRPSVAEAVWAKAY